MLIIGHRGARGYAPENTVESIKKALAMNVDMIELDVRIHKGELVLSHDETMKTASYCLLSEALAALNGKVPLILEIKESKVVKKLPKVLKNYKGEITFSSKKYDKLDILKEVKKVLPNARVAVTEGWTSLRAVALASLLNTKEIHLNQQWLWSGVVRSLKYRGYTIYAYTVNSKERADELAEWGIDGIFTDFPDRMITKST